MEKRLPNKYRFFRSFLQICLENNFILSLFPYLHNYRLSGVKNRSKSSSYRFKAAHIVIQGMLIDQSAHYGVNAEPMEIWAWVAKLFCEDWVYVGGVLVVCLTMHQSLKRIRLINHPPIRLPFRYHRHTSISFLQPRHTMEAKPAKIRST